MTETAAALRDFRKGFGDVHAWWLLAWDDVRSRYRRTILGPLWLTLSHGIYIVGLAISFSIILHRPLGEYFVYLAAGMTVWMFISHSFTEGPHIFYRAHNLMQSYDLPASIHIFRTVLQQLITFCHQILIYVAALFLVDNVANWNTLLVIPAMFVLLSAAVGWSTILALLGARFRDLGPAVVAVTQMAFPLTPIFWERANLKNAQWIADINPLYHLIEIVRAPLLGHAPAPLNWAVASGIAALLLLAAIALYAQKRRDLSYWI